MRVFLILLSVYMFVSCTPSRLIADEEANRLDTLHIKDTIIVDNDTVVHDSIVIKERIYKNPIIPVSLPDPTVVRATDGTFYLYATEDIRNVPIYKSDNLVDWSFVGTVFDDDSRPQINKGNVWAPDINYVNDSYLLYYSQSSWGGEWSCGIGVAVANTPEGIFIDMGKLFTSRDIDVKNSIDPFYLEDNGGKYLFWGSHNGIYGIKLSEDGFSVDGEKVMITNYPIEGTYIHYHEGYYYLFGSYGSCCSGINSSYRVVMARSESLFGPYTNKKGEDSFDSFLSGNKFVAGPGHNAEFITDDAGQDWIIYHGYLKSDPDAGRVVFLDPVYWKDGWPYIKNNSPSETNVKPFFSK